MIKKTKKIAKKIKFLVGAIIIGFLTFLEEEYLFFEIIFESICAID